MQVIKGVACLKNPLKGSVVTIGNFDGVHLGHQKLILTAIEQAKKLQVPSVVMTFDPHPLKFLFPEKKLKRIFSISDQIECFEKLGVDYVVFEPFSRELSQLTPELFIQDKIRAPFHPQSLVVGYDFSFGKGRSGSAEALKSKSKEQGFAVQIVQAFLFKGEVVSSTRIRSAIEAGDVELAKELLGRPFYLEGLVERGDGRGAVLGFPTANINSHSEMFPKFGVYCTRVFWQNREYDAVTNVGLIPTFIKTPEAKPRVESYIFDFSQMIYGEKIKVSFHHFLREEKKFSSKEDLQNQINSDVLIAKEWFKKHG